MNLYDNADHSSVAVVDDLLKRILKLQLTVLRKLGDFGGYTVLHNLLDGLSKNIGVPDAFLALSGIFLKLGNQVLCLLFTAYNRCDLCLDMGLDQIDGGGLRPHLDPVFVAVFNHFRLIKDDFRTFRRHNAISF